MTIIFPELIDQICLVLHGQLIDYIVNKREETLQTRRTGCDSLHISELVCGHQSSCALCGWPTPVSHLKGFHGSGNSSVVRTLVFGWMACILEIGIMGRYHNTRTWQSACSFLFSVSLFFRFPVFLPLFFIPFFLFLYCHWAVVVGNVSDTGLWCLDECAWSCLPLASVHTTCWSLSFMLEA